MNKEFREKYEQRWPEPDYRLPDDAPKPWYVAGYSIQAIDNVLRIDYRAARPQGRTYKVPNGEVRRVDVDCHLQGMDVGTLFLLRCDSRWTKELDRITELAELRGFEIRMFGPDR